jgi:putative glutamine amidotransferase
MKFLKPLIGITIDYLALEEMNQEQCYILRENYSAALSNNGAIPILLTHDSSNIDFWAENLDGLLFTGGNYDIDPSLYGEIPKLNKIILNDSRSNFEINLFKKFFATGKPILGICAGEQLMNVMLGGTLIQYIPDEIENFLEHSRAKDRRQFCHSVSIQKDTLLYNILQCNEIEVNTSHRQAVRTPGNNIIVNAIAPDNVIEGIEVKGHPFCLGVQWHPEYMLGTHDHKIFHHFVNSCHS